jgi:hypothetical protein
MELAQSAEVVAVILGLGAAVIGILQYTIRMGKSADTRRLEIFAQLEQSKLDNASLLVEVGKLESKITLLEHRIDELTAAVNALVKERERLESANEELKTDRDQARQFARILYERIQAHTIKQ